MTAIFGLVVTYCTPVPVSNWVRICSCSARAARRHLPHPSEQSVHGGNGMYASYIAVRFGAAGAPYRPPSVSG